MTEYLHRSRLDLTEVLEAGRQQHAISRFDEIDCAILEVGGKINVISVRS